MSSYTKLVAVPSDINKGLTGTSNNLMLSLLGSPRSSYSRKCEEPTNKAFRSRIVWGRSVGPFKVSGFDLAVGSLKRIMKEIKAHDSDLYSKLGSAGMLCCRFVRGSQSSISNHSWGTAVDIKIDGVLDRVGNDKVQYGLSLIAPVFSQHGWYWGAAFPKEDGMHFEVSSEKIHEWQSNGELFGDRTQLPTGSISFGDRGGNVKILQEKLNGYGHSLILDGIFGAGTHAAVIDFQSDNGLVPDGVVGKKTWRKLA